VVLSSTTDAHAQPFTRLIMPGEVIAGHAKYESSCEKCHQPFSKESQRRLCLDCHKEIDADIVKATGFHGRIPKILEIECKHCHSEHMGRKADIVQLDKETFDHTATDFVLRGSHLEVACGSCHETGKKYREAPSACIDCHRSDDVHKGKLGAKCADCHSETGWVEAKFDHGKTEFPLRGAHAEVTCASCHPAQRYENTPKDCYSCHRLQDVHRGKYGKQCEKCHSSVKWTKSSFDHAKTDFPLTGKHDEVPCNACHKGGLYDEELPTDCYSCHKHDDDHRGRNGTKCEDCHRTDSWTKVRFDHDKQTDFPLRGRHGEIACEACHRGNLETEKLESDCYSCHRHDDVHEGSQGTKCQSCHDERGWGGKVRFDHDLTRFPLIGMHAAAPCEECHADAVYRDTERSCNGCHAADDVHERRLGPDCATCHNPNGWALWRFDHDTQTDYPLTGSHAGLDCLACHKTPVKGSIDLSHACYACHRADDVHRGSYGRFCERCHTTEAFTDLRLQ